MCLISSEFFFPQNIIRRSDVSNACIFVEYHLVPFNSNQYSTDFNKTSYFEFHENFLSPSHTEVINTKDFQILKNQSMWKQKKL
jgi:hypothetical protein